MTVAKRLVGRAAILSVWTAMLVGVANTSHAFLIQSLSNPVPNGAITIDGNISDWSVVTPYQQDTIGDGSTGPARPLDIDILQGAVANDANNFYFLYRCTGDNMIDPFSNWVFIDTDQNASTGLKAGTASIPLSVGAEYNLGGLTGWNEWNADGSYAGPAAGKTVASGDSDGNGKPDFIEWKISRSSLQPKGDTFNATGSAFNLIFGAEDTTPDYSPNNGDVNWFEYRVGAVVPEPGTAMLLVIGLAGTLCARKRAE